MKKLWLRLKLMLLAFLPVCGFSNSWCMNRFPITWPIDTTTVRSLDISKYMGEWFEIARYENRFERGMSHVKATYSLGENGKILILNEGVKNGERVSAKGKGFIPDYEASPGRLRVSFFLWFYSDYYILELDELDYTYAVIGSSRSDFLWILYRYPVMSKELLNQLLERIENRGYDVSKLIYVNQT